MNTNRKIVTKKQLKEIVNSAKRQGKKIIATSGVFDMLHVGHAEALQNAKALGDILIVFLNDDNRTKQAKGENRPIIPEDKRALMLSALECVDYVLIFHDKKPLKLLYLLKPHTFAKGGDYSGKSLTEEEVMKRIGGEYVCLGYIGGYSTTNLINKILQLHF